MGRLRGFVVGVVTWAVVAAGAGVGPAYADTVRLGVVDDAAKAPHYQPLVGHLNFGGSFRFELVFYATAEELYEDFRHDKLRLALFGPVLYVEARHQLGVIPLVKDAPSSSVIFVRDAAPIRSVAELRGKRFAFGYPESTTSNLIPRLTMQQNQIGLDDLTADPSAFQPGGKKILFSYAGSHSAVIDAVLSGTADAGAVVDAIFNRNRNRGLRAVHTSEPYPGVPLVCHEGESAQFMSEVRRLFTSYTAPADSSHYYHFKEGAHRASDKDYDTVRYLCNVVLKTGY